MEGMGSCDCATNGCGSQPGVDLKTSYTFHVSSSGVEFILCDNFTQVFNGDRLRFTILRGASSIPTDGIGRLLITDISLTYGPTQTSALFCYATRDVGVVRESIIGDWCLQPEFDTTTASGRRIDGDNDRG